MERVVITRPIFGICHMQVCAAADATNEEILAVCNQKNPSGTENGWSRVIRENETSMFLPSGANLGPVDCSEVSGRKHFLVVC